jgi:hypothetical protein
VSQEDVVLLNQLEAPSPHQVGIEFIRSLRVETSPFTRIEKLNISSSEAVEEVLEGMIIKEALVVVVVGLWLELQILAELFPERPIVWLLGQVAPLYPNTLRPVEIVAPIPLLDLFLQTAEVVEAEPRDKVSQVDQVVEEGLMETKLEGQWQQQDKVRWEALQQVPRLVAVGEEEEELRCLVFLELVLEVVMAVMALWLQFPGLINITAVVEEATFILRVVQQGQGGSAEGEMPLATELQILEGEPVGPEGSQWLVMVKKVALVLSLLDIPLIHLPPCAQLQELEWLQQVF